MDDDILDTLISSTTFPSLPVTLILEEKKPTWKSHPEDPYLIVG